MHEVLVNRLGGLSLPRKSVVRSTERPDMTLDVYCGRKTTIQHKYNLLSLKYFELKFAISGKDGEINMLNKTIWRWYCIE